MVRNIQFTGLMHGRDSGYLQLVEFSTLEYDMYLNSDRFFKTLIMGNGFITIHVYSCTSALAPQNFEYFRGGLFAYLK